MSFDRLILGSIAIACALAFAAPRVASLGTIRAAPEGASAPKPLAARALAAAPPAVSTGTEISADRTGHYFTEARVDGFPVRVLVDTGATFLSLTEADARRVGLYLTEADFKFRTQTANGPAAVAHTTLHEVQIGNIRLHDVKASVSRGSGLPISLLGMSFLGRLSKVEASDGRLVLRP